MNDGDVKIDWNKKSCNTCLLGAIHHPVAYKGCLVSRECINFSKWIPKNRYKYELSVPQGKNEPGA